MIRIKITSCFSHYSSSTLIPQLGGCGVLGVGIWLSIRHGSMSTLSPGFPLLSAANILTTIGAVTMVAGFLGCLGAIKDNRCLLLSVRETESAYLRWDEMKVELRPEVEASFKMRPRIELALSYN